jgi:hypothetical protein
MTLDQLTQLQPGTDITVANNAFSCGGRAVITLEGADRRFWIFNTDGGMLSVAPNDGEIIQFQEIDEEVEPEGEMVLFRNKEYEFSYEDVGTMSEGEGKTDGEVEDQLTIADYEAEDGEVVRIVTNQNTGDQSAYLGNTVVEDDIQAV